MGSLAFGLTSGKPLPLHALSDQSSWAICSSNAFDRHHYLRRSKMKAEAPVALTTRFRSATSAHLIAFGRVALSGRALDSQPPCAIQLTTCAFLCAPGVGMSPGKSFLLPRPVPGARARLFCFPYAGGSASLFREWCDCLSPEIEIVAVQLPGRGTRYPEPLLRDTCDLVRDIHAEIPCWLGKPYGMFGHSMGAIIAYELAHLLQNDRHLRPFRLFVSGKRAVHLPRSAGLLNHQLPDPEFLQLLKEYGRHDAGIYENPELIELMMPIWRADFELAETYRFRSREPLNCPVTAYGGTTDKWVSEQDLLHWQALTAGEFSHRMFDGGHLFIHSQQKSLLESIRRFILADLAAAPPMTVAPFGDSAACCR